MYNDFNKILKSFEIGGISGPPKRGPFSKKNVQKRRANRARRKAIRQIKKNCGKPGCSRQGNGLV